ncbi:MAG: hypothetical protein V1913_15485 [Fibrobacterota bacterium]
MIGLSSFQRNVTPPLGHPLLHSDHPAIKVRDPLFARGLVFHDGKQKYVICVVDFCGILDRLHDEFTRRLAEAVGTRPEYVALHTVHQHDAPYMSLGGEKWLKLGGLDSQFRRAWWDKMVENVCATAKASLRKKISVAKIGMGTAKVSGLGANRRILGRNGKIWGTRWSKCRDPKVKAAPVGLVDPLLRAITFWGKNDRLISTISFYATHPQTADGRGIVSGDTVGEGLRLLRKKIPGAFHMYMTGCAGDVTYGKYTGKNLENNITRLGGRLFRYMSKAILRSKKQRQNLLTCRWKNLPVTLPVDVKRFPKNKLLKALKDKNVYLGERFGAAGILGAITHRKSYAANKFNCLSLNKAKILLLPGEMLLEYQFFAQKKYHGPWLAVAAYGDLKIGYVPAARNFTQGGYETTASRTTPAAETIVKKAIEKILAG